MKKLLTAYPALVFASSLLAMVFLFSLVAKIPENPKSDDSFSFPYQEYWQLAQNPSRVGYWEYVVWLRTYDKRIVEIVRCESEFNPFAKGDHNQKTYKAFGLLQFHQETFLAFAKKYGIENPNWLDPIQQIDLSKKMIDDGYGYLWTCWKKLNLSTTIG